MRHPLDDQHIPDEALSWAARAGQIDRMDRLVRAGADVNSNAYRGTPLLWAIYSDHADVTAWLLDRGADPDLRHDLGGRDHGKGAAALHLAAQYNKTRCLRLLLDRGADPTVVDENFGGTPLAWARYSQATDPIVILQAHLPNRPRRLPDRSHRRSQQSRAARPRVIQHPLLPR